MGVSLESSYELSQMGKQAWEAKGLAQGYEAHEGWEPVALGRKRVQGAGCLREQVGGKKGDEGEADHWGRGGNLHRGPRAVLRVGGPPSPITGTQDLGIQ